MDDMLFYDAVIAGLWIAFLLYWMLAAVGAKRNVRGSWSWSREIGFRLAFLVLVVLAWRVLRAAHVRFPLLNTSAALGIVGVALCALGIGFAIWARATLGRNWGLPMSQKESPDLVTSGPYAYVRHPVYAGMLLAMLGSAIGQSLVWLVPFVGAAAYFIISARREERLMLAGFPEQYPAYRKRTKMLLPFIW